MPLAPDLQTRSLDLRNLRLAHTGADKRLFLHISKENTLYSFAGLKFEGGKKKNNLGAKKKALGHNPPPLSAAK